MADLARPKRFELLTPRFVVWCSIQLSYGRLSILIDDGILEVNSGGLAWSCPGQPVRKSAPMAVARAPSSIKARAGPPARLTHNFDTIATGNDRGRCKNPAQRMQLTRPTARMGPSERARP
jgi:hypothetical protein